MKNILIKIILTICIFSSFGISTYAVDEENKEDGIIVTVTEKIPGANCTINSKSSSAGLTKITTYDCRVSKGFGGVTKMMGKIIKYLTYIAALGAVLFIVINGILYSMGGADPSIKDEAKKRITGTLVGLILLFLSGVILNMIAPWIYK